MFKARKRIAAIALALVFVASQLVLTPSDVFAYQSGDYIYVAVEAAERDGDTKEPSSSPGQTDGDGYAAGQPERDNYITGQPGEDNYIVEQPDLTTGADEENDTNNDTNNDDNEYINDNEDNYISGNDNDSEYANANDNEYANGDENTYINDNENTYISDDEDDYAYDEDEYTYEEDDYKEDDYKYEEEYEEELLPFYLDIAPFNVTDIIDLRTATDDDFGPGWTWTAATNTLRLTNFTMNYTGTDWAIRLPANTTVLLEGQNTINNTASVPTITHSAGGTLTFQFAAGATLDITANNTGGSTDVITTDGTGPAVSIIGNSANRFSITTSGRGIGSGSFGSGPINITNMADVTINAVAMGLWTRNLTVSGSVVDIDVSGTTSSSYGISTGNSFNAQALISILDGSTVTLNDNRPAGGIRTFNGQVPVNVSDNATLSINNVVWENLRTTPLNVTGAAFNQNQHGQGWFWDATNHVLTLNNFDMHIASQQSAITVPTGAAVRLLGENNVTTLAGSVHSVMTTNTAGATVYFEGAGILNANAPNTTGSAFSIANIVINGGTINVTSGGNGMGSNAANATVTINNGTVNIDAGNNGINTGAGGNVTIAGGTVNINAEGNGISGDDVAIEGGTVDIVADGNGINILTDDGSVNISGGSVSIEADGQGIYDRGGAVDVEIDADADVVVDGETWDGDGWVPLPPNGGGQPGNGDGTNNLPGNGGNNNQPGNGGGTNNQPGGGNQGGNQGGGNQGGGNQGGGSGGGGGGHFVGGGSGGGGRSRPSSRPATRTTTLMTPPTLTISANVDADGNVIEIPANITGGRVSLELPRSMVTNLINNAEGDAIIFDASSIRGATSVNFPRAAIRMLGEAELGILVKLPAGEISLDAEAVASIGQLARTNAIRITLEEVSSDDLSSTRQESLQGEYNQYGAHNDYNQYSVFRVLLYSGSIRIENFDGYATITIPFEGPAPTVWFLNEDGTKTAIPSHFNEYNETITFAVSALEYFTIGQGPAPTPAITPEDTTWEPAH